MKVTYNAPVTLTFALVCVAVQAANLASGDFFLPLFSVGPTMRWDAPVDYVRLVTYVFGHAGAGHLTGNLMMLLLLGPMLEEKYGPAKLAFMGAVTAIVTGLFQVLIFRQALVGASGIVFMMILLASITNAKRGTLPLTFVFVAVLYVGQEVVNSFGPDRVSQFAHIMGGACGAGFGLLPGARTGKQS